jgi:hypothetical protein
MVRNLESLLDRQKRELAKGEALLAEVDEQVKGVQATRDEVKSMMEEGIGEGRSTTPEVEPPVVEALTPPAMEDVQGGQESTGDELAGLENLDPEIVALLRADMGLTGQSASVPQYDEMVEEYAP